MAAKGKRVEAAGYKYLNELCWPSLRGRPRRLSCNQEPARFCAAQIRLFPQEAAMTALTKKATSHLARWFKQVVRQNKTPYRWYEVDITGM